MTEGKILIGMMDKYDNDLMSALGAKQREVSLVTTVEQVRAIDAQSGYPDKVNITMTYVRQQANQTRQTKPTKTLSNPNRPQRQQTKIKLLCPLVVYF